MFNVMKNYADMIGMIVGIALALKKNYLMMFAIRTVM